MGVLGRNKRKVFETLQNFVSGNLGEVNIGEETLHMRTNKVKSGLEEMMGSMKIREGDNGGVPGNA